MEDISREEAIKNITAYVYMECENLPMQVIKALDIAKLDMKKAEKLEKENAELKQKVEKIEKIIDDMLNTCRSDEYHNEGYKIMLLQLKTLNKIEHIVKD